MSRFPTGGVMTCSQCYGGHGERETPGHIPNPEAKPFSADGTAPGTGWESRTPPDNHSRTGPNHQVWPRSACPQAPGPPGSGRVRGKAPNPGPGSVLTRATAESRNRG